MYGWRGRVGLVHPSRGETLMYEFCKVAPEGVIPVSTALGVQRLVVDQLSAILDRYEAAVREMVYEECDVIQLGGTPPVTSGIPVSRASSASSSRNSLTSICDGLVIVACAFPCEEAIV